MLKLSCSSSSSCFSPCFSFSYYYFVLSLSLFFFFFFFLLLLFCIFMFLFHLSQTGGTRVWQGSPLPLQRKCFARTVFFSTNLYSSLCFLYISVIFFFLLPSPYFLNPSLSCFLLLFPSLSLNSSFFILYIPHMLPLLHSLCSQFFLLHHSCLHNFLHLLRVSDYYFVLFFFLFCVSAPTYYFLIFFVSSSSSSASSCSSSPSRKTRARCQKETRSPRQRMHSQTPSSSQKPRGPQRERTQKKPKSLWRNWTPLVCIFRGAIFEFFFFISHYVLVGFVRFQANGAQISCTSTLLKRNSPSTPRYVCMHACMM